MSYHLSIMTSDTGEGYAIASLFDADDVHDSMPIAEGEGATPDEAVAALFSKVTFNDVGAA